MDNNKSIEKFANVNTNNIMSNNILISLIAGYMSLDEIASARRINKSFNVVKPMHYHIIINNKNKYYISNILKTMATKTMQQLTIKDDYCFDLCKINQIHNLQYLLHIDVYECHMLSDINLEYISKFINLQSLKFYIGHRLTESGIIQHITKLINLQCIGINYDNDKSMKNIFPHLINSMKMLNEFEFIKRAHVYNKPLITIYDDMHIDTRYISKLQKLTFVHAPPIEHYMLKYINKLSCLIELTINNYELMDTDLIYIDNLTNLQKLNVFQSRLITNKSATQFGKLRKLRILNMHCCEKITDEGINCLKNLSNLQELDMSNFGNVTDIGMQYISELVNLEKLDIGGCNKITDEGFKHICKLQNLRHIDIADCTRLSHDGFKYLHQLSKLYYFCIGYHHLIIKNNQLINKIQNMSKLCKLKIEGNIIEFNISELREIINNGIEVTISKY